MGDARERGAALVEFALVSLVLYLLLAGTIEFGRLMFDANALQDVARVAARELALAPVRANATFDYALSCDATTDPDCLVDLKSRIFDPACLVVDLSDPAVSGDPDGFFAAMPVVNRALRTLMITEPQRPNLLRYAGALMSDSSGTACSAIGPNGQAAATGLTVGIPLVETRDASGGESITWVPVLQEIRAAGDAECPSRGPFSLVYIATNDDCGALQADPLADRALPFCKRAVDHAAKPAQARLVMKPLVPVLAHFEMRNIDRGRHDPQAMAVGQCSGNAERYGRDQVRILHEMGNCEEVGHPNHHLTGNPES